MQDNKAAENEPTFSNQKNKAEFSRKSFILIFLLKFQKLKKKHESFLKLSIKTKKGNHFKCFIDMFRFFTILRRKSLNLSVYPFFNVLIKELSLLSTSKKCQENVLNCFMFILCNPIILFR
jgi:hypothetical protein